MKTQISRHRFDPADRYSGVQQQMGRMITDADWNELDELVRHRLVDTLADIVGEGSPRARGLVRRIGDDGYALRWGHVYVDGIPARVVPDDPSLPPPLRFERQADLPGVPPLAEGSHRLYLDVWERSVTQLESPDLMDPGLHGADTCTRSQTMAQVKACPVDLDPRDPALNPPRGNIPLGLSVRQGTTLDDPCDPCAEELALPEDVGNFLFRVEVHEVSWSDDPVPEVTGLTLKWSRENGAEAYRVDSLPPGFASDRWSYEYFAGPEERMRSERHLGHHLMPGFEPERGVLTVGHAPASAPDRSLVRRWDGHARLTREAGQWQLAEGADRGTPLSTGHGEGAHGRVDITGGPEHRCEIHLDQLVLSLQLDAPLAVAGDYWLATVRQVEHAAGDTLLEESLPVGVAHHYWLLGQVEVDAEGEITAFSPDPDGACRALEFPPLTDIDAGDVCYRNDACELPGVRSVEQALDHLCRQRDLSWHHRQLHGWGVVCGLIAECGGEVLPDNDGRLHHRRVRVTPGHALDCEGRDIVIEERRFLDVMAALEGLDESVLEDGSGQVYLYVELDDDGEPRLAVATEPPADNDSPWWQGQLWLDFYNDCLKGVIDAVRGELEVLGDDSIEEAERGDTLVSPQRKRVTTLMNLLAELLYRPHGERVFLSRKEHELLRDFYLHLREILQSRTFCGMFRGHDFPDYPLETGMTTWFGKHHHDTLVRQPDGDLLASLGGASSQVNLYHAGEGRLAAVSQVPSAEGANLTAGAFSPDGRLFYVAADINGTDSILSRARVEGNGLHWETSAVLCGMRITELRFVGDQPRLLLAIGLGSGLFVLNLAELFGEEKQIPAPALAFNAAGHLAITPDGEWLYATASPDEGEWPEGRYDRVLCIRLGGRITRPERVHTLDLTEQQADTSGSDGIAVGPRPTGERLAESPDDHELFIAIDGRQEKHVWRYAAPWTGQARPRPAALGLADTRLRLHYHADEEALLVSLEDEFRVGRYRNGKPLGEYIPVQLMPCDFCIDGRGDLQVLNFASNTITWIPRDELAPEPGAFAPLRAYRREVLQAFIGLFGNLVQNLKDCFCHLLLTRCPECEGDERIWLAKVEIRDHEVYHICNFSRRRHVKTFPKLEYWLSLVPVLPGIRQAVQRLCCAILPDWFETRLAGQGADTEVSRAPLKAGTYHRLAATLQRADPPQLLRARQQELSLATGLARDGLLNRGQAPRAKQATVSRQAYRDLPTEEALGQLEAHRIEARVEPYDPARSGEYIRRFTATPERIPEGSRVTVIEEQGRVKFYALEPDTAVPDATRLAELERRKAALGELGEIEHSLDDLAGRREQLTDLQGVDADLERLEARKQAVRELGDLQQALGQLEQQRQSSTQEVAELGEQLTQLRTERVELQDSLAQLQSQLASSTDALDALRVETERLRPLEGLEELDVQAARALREQGVLTLGDLAELDAQQLTRTTGLSRPQADQLVESARLRLNPRPR
ncbi:DUF6519 domain-containing protein [Halomonas sp. C05BenzN]|uniref:DUF6519 domain-containing protein n=1 Tax=Halomonas sp. C05BenzN TaxID=3411041 RepID=UPI003B966077